MKRFIRFITGCFLTSLLILNQGCQKESEIPEISTFPVFELTTTTAETGGMITSEGGDFVYSRGLCWDISPNPTVNDHIILSPVSTGPFIIKLSDLEPETKYFFRAFAKNKFGTAYGIERSFITKQANIPALRTELPSFITSTSVVTGGYIYSDGGLTVTNVGICWGTEPNPTLWGGFPAYEMSSEEGYSGKFTIYLPGLNPNTTYYVRSYASNKIGQSYGEAQVFTTLSAK
jgi:hypothetical protein